MQLNWLNDSYQMLSGKSTTAVAGILCCWLVLPLSLVGVAAVAVAAAVAALVLLLLARCSHNVALSSVQLSWVQFGMRNSVCCRNWNAKVVGVSSERTSLGLPLSSSQLKRNIKKIE